MVRKTALVTALLGALSSQAMAMGLGEIQLHSALNQPLLAEIELLSPTAADLTDLRAALASSEAYAKAGVERAFFHTKLRFEVIKRPNGTAAIKVTSREPVREPYLDFLIEATWGSGQVLREYTVLVDPPVLMPAPAPDYAAPAMDYAPTPAPLRSAPASAPSGRLVDGQYHVGKNDTAWSIAQQVRPDSSVSIHQTMIGLLQANPNAFIDRNINKLKAGQVLRVPSREEIQAISQADALSQARAQKKEWQGSTAPAEPAEAAPAAAPAEPAAADPAAEADAQLKLVAPKTEGEADKPVAGEQSVEELRKELTLASEAVEAQRLENNELSSRLAELEEQNKKLHSLLELKNAEMAQLAGQAPADAASAAAPGSDAAADSAPAAAADASDAAPAAADAGTPETAAADAVETAEAEVDGDSAAATDAADSDATAEAEDMSGDAADATADSAPAPEVAPAAPPVQAAKTSPKAPAEDEGLLAMLMNNTLLQAGVAGAAVLVGLLAWMTGRRRRMEDADFQESILADKQTNTAKKAAAASAASAAVAEAASEPQAEAAAADSQATDSSLFTDFAVSDMGNLQSDAEADPVAEADVYLAYGRYQQAEELIRSAVSRSPERNELRLKLLEVLFAAKNANAFDAEAEALLAILGSPADDMWLRVVEMGKELNPGNPLYGDMTASAAPAEPEQDLDYTLGGSDTNALDFTAPEEPAPATTEDNSLDFDLGELDAFTSNSEEAAPSMPVEEDLSFDLSAGAGDEDAFADDGQLSTTDEVATKLDLARAYIEMGDPDGARSILQEVLEEGNDKQQAEAQSLLSTVG